MKRVREWGWGRVRACVSEGVCVGGRVGPVESRRGVKPGVGVSRPACSPPWTASRLARSSAVSRSAALPSPAPPPPPPWSLSGGQQEPPVRPHAASACSAWSIAASA